MLPSRREIAAQAAKDAQASQPFCSQPEVPAQRESPTLTPSQPVERPARSVRQANAAAKMEERNLARGYLPPSKRGRR